MPVFCQTTRCLAGLLLCASVGLAMTAVAQTNATPGGKDSIASGKCAVRDRSPAIVVMICTPDAKSAHWRVAAMAACGASRDRCNVWIWDDAALAPSKAPVLDADMPRDLAGRAVAVWAHDSQSLLEIRKTR